MTLAACLALFATAAAWGLPRVLHRFGGAENSPRFGVAVWMAAVGGVVAAWVAAAAMILTAALTAVSTGEFTQACLALLSGSASEKIPLQPVLAVLATVLLPVMMAPAWRTGRALAAAVRARRKLTGALRLVGRPAWELGIGTLVIDASEREAYCLSGGTGTVVLTTGALEALRPDEVRAVLAHERAHLSGRHHAVLTLLAALHRGAPRVPLFAAADREVARLLEMCADDVAVRRHGSTSLVTALLAMASGSRTPRGALGAGGHTALARARRLLAPPTVTQRLTARVALATLAAGVVLAGVAPLALMVSQFCAVVLA